MYYLLSTLFKFPSILFYLFHYDQHTYALQAKDLGKISETLENMYIDYIKINNY